MTSPTTSDQKVLTHSVKQRDKHLLATYLDEMPTACYSMATNFIGFAVKEKGIRYFFPKGAKIMLVRGELICFVHEYIEPEPTESMA